MLIRSQDKLNFFNINVIDGIVISYYYSYYQLFSAVAGREYFLGKYSTKEKAIKVLDMIQEQCLEPTYISDIGSGEYAKYEHVVFQMPEDCEVEND